MQYTMSTGKVQEGSELGTTRYMRPNGWCPLCRSSTVLCTFHSVLAQSMKAEAEIELKLQFWYALIILSICTKLPNIWIKSSLLYSTGQ